MFPILATKYRRYAFGILAVLTLFSGNSLAETTGEKTAAQWLQDMKHAVGKFNYQGTLVYLEGKRMDSFKVFHGLVDGVERERMLSTNSPRREVVRNADKVTCYFPDNKTIAIEQKSLRRSILLDVPEDTSALEKLYTFAIGDTATVAQREARLVSINPKDDLRYKRMYWIDVVTKLPLKFELLDENGQSVEQIIYTDLLVTQDTTASTFNPATQPDKTWTVKEHKTLSADSLKWTLVDVPEGFHLVSYSSLRRAAGDGAIDHILLSDGFASVSIYIDEIADDGSSSHPRKFGAINSVTKKLGSYLITVMGEVPEKAVQYIAYGIHRQTH